MNNLSNNTESMNDNETKMYRIFLRHTGSKDSVEVVKTIVLAHNTQQILSFIADNNSSFTGASGVWLDRHVEDGLWNIKNAEGDVIGTETYFERMLRLRGEYFDPDLDYSDKYYGIHHYGWDEGKVISQEEKDVLLRLNIVEDWTNYSCDLVKQHLPEVNQTMNTAMHKSDVRKHYK